MTKLPFLVVIMIPMTAPMATTPMITGGLTFIMALFTSLLTFTWYFSWLASVLFLIYIGGLMVMFSYFMSIQPNQQMDHMSTIIGLVMNLSFIAMMIDSPLQYIYQTTPSITMILHNQYIYLLLLLTGLLFLAMIITVSTTKHSGALRPFSTN